MAGNTAYSGVMEALDCFFRIKKKGRKSVECYQEVLGKMDRKILTTFNSAYNNLHLFKGYDGELDVEIRSNN